MQTFSGWEYLLIDACNQHGGDKMLFDERIEWATQNLDQLEAIADQRVQDEMPLPRDEKWKEEALYRKAVQAIRKAQQGIPTGHLVGMDACASGIQVMSAMTGCVIGAQSTGLVGNVRSDAYGICTEHMNTLLQAEGLSVDVPRKDAKRALMTAFYSSTDVPKEIFGEDTPELNAFYQAAQATAPGAWELLQDLKAAWQPYALVHQWKLPDGFDARVKVMEKVSARVEVDELDHATFTYEFYENMGSKKGRSLPANVVHSTDGYVLRCIHRRCNYNAVDVTTAYAALLSELQLRVDGYNTQIGPVQGTKLAYYIEQYERSGMADVVILPYIKDGHQTQYLGTEHMDKLVAVIQGMLQYQPFEVVGVHDEFKCHPNHMNHLRQQYINIFAELAESNILADILSQIHGTQGTYPKLSNNLGELIRNSNYSLS